MYIHVHILGDSRQPNEMPPLEKLTSQEKARSAGRFFGDQIWPSDSLRPNELTSLSTTERKNILGMRPLHSHAFHCRTAFASVFVVSRSCEGCTRILYFRFNFPLLRITESWGWNDFRSLRLLPGVGVLLHYSSIMLAQSRLDWLKWQRIQHLPNCLVLKKLLF